MIGAGLTGCAAAFRLASSGAEVLVLERGEVNGGASGANGGSLHVQIPHEPFLKLGDRWAASFASTLPLLLESVTLWRRVEAQLGTDLEVSLKGGLLIAHTPAERAAIERKAALERRCGVDVEVISGPDARALAPYLSDGVECAAFCPTEGKANPLLCTPAFARAAQARGADIRTGCEVRSLVRETNGWRLSTNLGVFKADRVINAAGSHAGRVAELVGLPVDVESFPIQLSVTQPVGPLVEHLVYAASEKLTLKQTRQGGIIIGGGWPAELDAAGRPVVRVDSLARNLELARRTVPAVGDLRLLRSWAAFVNGNASWMPIIGEAPGSPGFIMAYTPWIGFTASLATAYIAADIAIGSQPETSADLKAFAPA